jgi:anti-sigma regulatory factor (Ser/Thr protein kinase)
MSVNNKGEAPPARHDIVLARQQVRRLTQELYLLVDQTKMVTAASELVRNASSMAAAGDGMGNSQATAAAVSTQVCRRRPGHPNLDLAMTDGGPRQRSAWGSRAQRLVNEFGLTPKWAAPA